MKCAVAMWLSLMFASCAVAQTPKKVTFDEHVLPVLRDKCLGCHNADKARGGLDASTFGKLMEGGSSGPVVKPGDASGSRLFTLTSHAEEPKMPPKSPPIAQASIDTIKAWIEQGALENAGSKAVAVMEKKAEVAKVIVRSRPAVPPLPTVALPQDPAKTKLANAVTALATSPWAPLAAVSGPKSVLLYNTDSLELVGILPFTHGQINVLKFARSGELLLAAGGRGGKSGKVVLYDIKTGKIASEFGDETDAIIAADLSPDQSMVAIGGPNRLVRVLSTADGHKIRDIKKHTDWVTAIEFSPDGVLLATGDRNGGLQVWEAGTGREFFSLPGHKGAITDLAWRDDANNLLSASEDGAVKWWEMEDGKQVRSVAAHGAGTAAVRVGHDNRVLTAGRDLVVKLFDGNGAEQRKFAGVVDLPMRVAISHDGNRVLVGDWTGAIRVWNAADANPLGVLSTNPPTAAERLQLAQAEAATKVKAVEQAAASVSAAQAAVDQLTKEYAITQKAAGDVTAAASAATALVPTLKTANDRSIADATAAKAKLAAADAIAKLLTDAATAVRAEADKAKDAPGLAAIAIQAMATADAARAEAIKAKGVRDAAHATQKDLAAKLATAVTAAPALQAKVKPAQDAVPPKAKALQDALAKLATAKSALTAATAERDAANATAERLRTSLAKRGS